MRAVKSGGAVVREPSRVELDRIEEMVALSRRDLAELGYTGTSLEESLLVLTRSIADPRTSAAGLVACVKEFRRQWPTGPLGDRPTDELKRRRNRWRPT